MSYEELKNKSQESEILSLEDEKVRRMCETLKRVNAPKNFDFHLKARIANANPKDFQQTAFFPVLRYVLPLSLVLLIAGFVALSGSLMNNQSPDLMLADNFQPVQTSNAATNLTFNPETSASRPESQNNSISAVTISNAEPKRTISNVQLAVARNKNNNSAPKMKNIALSEEFGGTRQSASRDSLIINPPGIPVPSNVQSNSAKNIGSQTTMSVKNLLSEIGIDADFANSGWSVKNVRSNSLANRAGIKTGDFIESADGRKLDSETITGTSFSTKTIYLVRGGKRIAVELR